MCVRNETLKKRNQRFDHDSTLYGYTGPGTTWAKKHKKKVLTERHSNGERAWTIQSLHPGT